VTRYDLDRHNFSCPKFVFTKILEKILKTIWQKIPKEVFGFEAGVRQGRIRVPSAGLGQGMLNYSGKIILGKVY
jgi:hypothetical protein